MINFLQNGGRGIENQILEKINTYITLILKHLK